MKKTGAMGVTKPIGKITPAGSAAKPVVVTPKGAGRIGNLGDFAHPPKRKGRGK